MKLKEFLKIFLFLFFFSFFSKEIFAKDFQTDYQAFYYLNKDNPQITNVSFKIGIKHLRSDVRLKKFSLSFQDIFKIDNISAFINNNPINYNLENLNNLTILNIEIPDNYFFKKDDLYEVNLNFNQRNLIQINGNVLELILPTVKNQEDDFNYKATIVLPQGFDKKISLSKPIPTHISNNQIVWENPKVKTIYAVFGEKQIYKSLIYYGIENERIVPIYTEVAFPPDTLYQEVFIDKIIPQPVEVYQDQDGNFLGKYLLKPKEKMRILFEGKIVVYSQPREEIKKIIKDNLNNQKRYLLNQTKEWQINNVDQFKDLKNVADIYYYLVNNFKYDYQRLTKKNIRTGADQALKEKTGICTEFSDSFVALAREKGILAREIQGYGFSSDTQLRPIALSSDVLHSWPEFFDLKTNLWVPVDPTWENTSGIDYFSSFDLNHLVFVIHGKDSQYPIPAGAYKIEDSKDILIDTVNTEPKKNYQLKIELKKTEINRLIAGKKYQWSLFLENKSNVYLYNQKVSLESDNKLINFSPSSINIVSLLPLERKNFKIELAIKEINKKNKDTLLIKLNDKINQKIDFEILPKISRLIGFLVLINFVFVSLLFIISYAKRRRN